MLKSTSPDFLASLGNLALGTRLKRLGDRLQTGVAEATEGNLRVSPSQMPMLVALSQHPDIAVGDLAQGLGISQPAVSRTLTTMAREGLVEFNSDDQDARVRKIRLTDAGKEALAELRKNFFPKVSVAASELCADLKGGILEQIAELEARLKAESFATRVRRAAQ